MRRNLLFTVICLFMLVSLLVTGCQDRQPAGVISQDGEEIVSSCVRCHTDKDLLKEVASPEEEETVSEATSGEG